jgi:hypothetical protein
VCNHRRARRKTALDQPEIQTTRSKWSPAAAEPRFYTVKASATVGTLSKMRLLVAVTAKGLCSARALRGYGSELGQARDVQSGAGLNWDA